MAKKIEEPARTTLEEVNESLTGAAQKLEENKKYIYYASGESIQRIKNLPQTEMVRDKGYEILYLTESVDEFCIKMLGQYDGKQFQNICDEKFDLDSEDEKNALKEKNEQSKDLFFQ